MKTIQEEELMQLIYKSAFPWKAEHWKDEIEWLRKPENAKRNNIFI